MDIKALFEPSVQEFIQQNINADIRELALRAQGKFDLPLGFLLDQVNGRQKAKKKLPTWFSNNRIVYPIDLSMQQCSSELSAKLKMKDIPNGRMCIDLGGGFGVDTYYLAKKFAQVLYVEQDKDLCDIVEHNCEVLGLKNVRTVNHTVEEFIDALQIKVDLIYIDPARRDENQNRTVQFEDCSPNILEIKAALKERASNLLIKASPVIDIRLAFEQFPDFKGVQIVGVNNECKEVVFHTYEKLPSFKCSNSSLGELEEHVFEDQKGGGTPLFSELGNYIYEPNVTIRKAQKQDDFAEQFNLKKLFKNGSLFTSTELKKGFSGRIFKVENELSSKKEIQNLKDAEVIAKNFPMAAADFKKKYKLGASSSKFIIAFTDYSGEKKIVLCSKV
jgi:hypothetical protein